MTAALATGHMRAAVNHRAELVFVYENTCGHGAFADGGSDRCPGHGERWVDVRCDHPSDHYVEDIAALFTQVIAP